MILYNNQRVNFGQFPNGESYLKKIEIDPEITRHVVTLKYENDTDLFHLALLRYELSGLGIQELVLRITYVPYSRMDRDNGVYTFSLITFADFINSMEWGRVVIYEPHSDVTPALLNRVQVVDITASPLMQSKVNIAFGSEDYQVFFPDAGAQKRYEKFQSAHQPLVGYKTRDFETGKITESHVVGEQKSKNVVILDDLCSKGGTFALAAAQLWDMGFRRIILAVAHCEFTIFSGGLFLPESYIEKVITTDSIMPPSSQFSKLDVYPLTDWKW